LSIERLEERARVLAASFTLARDTLGRARPFYARLDDNARVLRDAYGILAGDVHRGEFLSPAAEWHLDNFHLIESEFRGVRHDLPREYYRSLPKLAPRELAGMARIYAMALELIRHTDGRLDRVQLVRFMAAYQTVAPLTIGELWAWPSMLKLALIENLRRLAEETLEAREARLEADRYLDQIAGATAGAMGSLPATLQTAYIVRLLQRMREYGPLVAPVRAAVEERLTAQGMTAEDVIRAEHQAQATGQVSVGNAITSLRLCSAMDWAVYFESVSQVEQVLRRDPAAAYGQMDFQSRDRYRQAVEELAEPSGEAQLRVALRVVESARHAAEQASPDARAAHVGYHLIGAGRRKLETDVSYQPTVGGRARRFVSTHATGVYLGSIGLVTGILLILAAAYARLAGGDAWTQAVAVALLLLPASELAIGIVQRLAAHFLPPRRLPRLEFLAGVPEAARTMVVIPTLLTSVHGVAELLEHLEVLALGNSDPQIHFAILSDFTDASAETRPGDAEILDSARAGIDALNARTGGNGTGRFHLLHRVRLWNPREGCWMGWERKRGKLEEFNRLLRGATDTSFHVHVGDPTFLPGVRNCITLDSDTRLPRNAARKLIGIIAHPLNRPHFDPQVRRVTEGYGILQPRVSVTLASAAGSLFARVYAGHTGVDPYTTAVSDTYQDLFSEGIFTGKGLYDVDAFMAALEGRVPENALLSHDLFEGLHARPALVTDVEVVDDYPASVLTHARRQHRWARGDWQILAWLFPLVPTRQGLERNTLPVIARWKILDNLRRTLVAPATVLALAGAWLVLPGAPGAWTALILGTMAFPLYPLVVRLLAGPAPQQPFRVFWRLLIEDLKTAGAQVLLLVTFLAYHAYEMAHAIGLTLVRLIVTQRRLLEWETAAATAARSAGLAVRGGLLLFIGEMAASPLTALLLLFLVAGARPASGGRPRACAVARRAAHRLVAQPAGDARPPPARRRRAPAAPCHRAEDLALLRHLHGRRRSRPPAGQRPGIAGPGRGAPHFAHEHRDGAALHPGRPRPRLPPYGRAGGEARVADEHDGGTGTLRGPSPQLVRHQHPGPAAAGVRLDGGQREPRGSPDRAGRGAAGNCGVAPILRTAPVRPAGHRRRRGGRARRLPAGGHGARRGRAPGVRRDCAPPHPGRRRGRRGEPGRRCRPAAGARGRAGVRRAPWRGRRLGAEPGRGAGHGRSPG
jgi:cyclic beta-1,2-glucan synthetase